MSFTADIPLFNSNITNFTFCAFKGVEELVERIASMERGGADTTPLISRRFAFPFVCMQLVTPNVAAIAVSTMMRMMGILLEVNELLL